MATVFFSYSHADENLRDQLEKHLSALKRQGLIEAWHDRRIVAGREFDHDISANLENADVVLLLVSADFLASDYCYEREMIRAVDRHKTGQAAVIPVILRPCDWHETPFGGLQAVPKDGRAITQWANPDEAFLDAVTAIKRALRERGATTVIKNSGPSVQMVSKSAPRSSNLRVRKNFTQRDHDRFLHDAFEYVARFFENSLNELERRGPDIEHSFKRIDGNRFTAAAYRDGKKTCQCSVFVGGMLSGIGYAGNDRAETNGFNENLSVEADEQTLYLKPMGIQSFGREQEKFGFEGAAEHLWGMFLEPLQRG
jgi:TIR domain